MVDLFLFFGIVSSFLWITFAVAAHGYALDFWGDNFTYIVVDSSYAVVVGVADVHFDVTSFLVVETADSTWLIKAAVKSGSIKDLIFALSEPREDFVPERVDNFDFVVVCVSH